MVINQRVKREAKQLFGLCLVNEILDENRTRRVVNRVLSSGRRHGPAVLAHFLRLVRLERAAHSAKVESAAPLPPDLRTAIQAGLLRRYGLRLTASFSQRPSLIAGVRIQVGSDVYDGSIQAKLRALEMSF